MMWVRGKAWYGSGTASLSGPSRICPVPRSPVKLTQERQACRGPWVQSCRPCGGELEDTWWSRDLPVLDAAVKLFQSKDFVEVGDLARSTGFEPEDVARALRDMRGVYVGEIQGMGDMERWCITEVTPEARRAVGQWPTPENVVGRLAEAFSKAAEHEPDPERRGKLRTVGSFLGDTGKDFAAEVVAKVIARQTGVA